MDRAEGTSARATTTRQDRHNTSTEHCLRFVVTVGIRQLIKVFKQLPRFCQSYSVFMAKCDAVNFSPICARHYRVYQLIQRGLSFKAHHAIEFRNQFQRLFIAQTGEVPAHGEVSIDTVPAKQIQEGGILIDEELKN